MPRNDSFAASWLVVVLTALDGDLFLTSKTAITASKSTTKTLAVFISDDE